jgi:hypothetical protein
MIPQFENRRSTVPYCNQFSPFARNAPSAIQRSVAFNNPIAPKTPIPPKIPVEPVVRDYVVSLVEDKEINSVNDITNLYRGFVLPSWLSDRSAAKILKRTRNGGLTKVFRVDGAMKVSEKRFNGGCFSYMTEILVTEG